MKVFNFNSIASLLVRIGQLEHLGDVGSGFEKFFFGDFSVGVEVAIAEGRLDLFQKVDLAQRLALQLVKGLRYSEKEDSILEI